MAGIQSIKTTDLEKYSDQAMQNLLAMSDAYFYKKRFNLGNGIDRDKMRHYRRIEKIMCSDDCEVTIYVKKKIAGLLEGCDYGNLPSVFEKHEHGHEGNNYYVTQVIKEEFLWDNISW